jgi:beta-mannosidase
MLRVWGGAAAEREVFYDLCDELGLLVWQELPLSSSGLDNAPPDDPDFAAGLAAVARSYALRLGHHPCIVLWSGGNELTAVTAPAVPGAPLTDRHPALRAARDALAAVDPGRRFIATSPLGPRFEADAAEFGRGLHHDVHGPWEFSGSEQEWADYWASDDAVLRSEVGVAGASPLSLLHDVGLTSSGGTERTRQLWTHSSGWWLAEFDRTATDDLATWVTESQERQARLLAVAAGASARRFPACAGFLVWLGHDAFPCAVSLSLLDFDGRPKPAAAAVAAAIAEGLGADA